MATATSAEKWKRKLKRNAVLALATGGYSGYAPLAPGTFGSGVGVLLVWLFWDTSLFFQCALSAFLAGVGVWASHEAGLIFKEADSGHIVIDEVVGMMITMIGIPASGYWLFCGFVLFRILDVVKLPPAHIFDRRVKNGWGVMLDDVFAGIYGNVVLHLMLRTTI